MAACHRGMEPRRNARSCKRANPERKRTNTLGTHLGQRIRVHFGVKNLPFCYCYVLHTSTQNSLEKSYACAKYFYLFAKYDAHQNQSKRQGGVFFAIK